MDLKESIDRLLPKSVITEYETALLALQPSTANHKFLLSNKPKKWNKENQLGMAGLYAFWWTGDPEELREMHRKVRLQGKEFKGGAINEKHLAYDFEWQVESFPQCLYVGKSTNLFSRLNSHLSNTPKYSDWFGEEALKLTDRNEKRIEKTRRLIASNKESNHLFPIKHTTACQFRAGMQLLLNLSDRADGFNGTLSNVTYCYYPMNEIKNLPLEDGRYMLQRFFLEDLAIGLFRPWFNVDGER